MKFYLHWEMDGCQWVTEQIFLYANKPKYDTLEGTYLDCLFFIHDNLMNDYDTHDIHYYFDDESYVFNRKEITDILKTVHPERFI